MLLLLLLLLLLFLLPSAREQGVIMEGIIEWNLEDRQFMLWSAVLSLAFSFG